MSRWVPTLTLCVLVLHLCHKKAVGCDFFNGRWVVEYDLPMYNDVNCPFVQKEFSCWRNGRPDLLYSEYGWEPADCKLRRFDGDRLLKKLAGKEIMFVGDSLSLNQWQSLTCMIFSTLSNVKYNISREGEISTFTFKDYNVKVMIDRNVYLVDVANEKIGRVLKLDSIEGGNRWRHVDVLIFNTWHWWNRRGPSQLWDYIQIGEKIKKDMNRLDAFETALTTWAKWVDSTIDTSKQIVFFQGISPTHYNGTMWHESQAKACMGQTQPMASPDLIGKLPPATTVLKKVLGRMSKHVTLLDITVLSMLRKDGHPSSYGYGGPTGMDCSHWCLPGVPDAWNQILYNLII